MIFHFSVHDSNVFASKSFKETSCLKEDEIGLKKRNILFFFLTNRLYNIILYVLYLKVDLFI